MAIAVKIKTEELKNVKVTVSLHSISMNALDFKALSFVDFIESTPFMDLKLPFDILEKYSEVDITSGVSYNHVGYNILSHIIFLYHSIITYYKILYFLYKAKSSLSSIFR